MFWFEQICIFKNCLWTYNIQVPSLSLRLFWYFCIEYGGVKIFCLYFFFSMDQLAPRPPLRLPVLVFITLLLNKKKTKSHSTDDMVFFCRCGGCALNAESSRITYTTTTTCGLYTVQGMFFDQGTVDWLCVWEWMRVPFAECTASVIK